MFNDTIKYFNKIRNKIYLMLARGVVTAINNSEKTQKVQILCLKDETISDIERFEQYGLATYPNTNTEAFISFLNGNRSQGIVLAIHDRELKPSYLLASEVSLYGALDKTVGQRVWMRADGSITIMGGVINLVGVTNVAGALVATSSLTGLGVSDLNATTPTMALMRALFNAHVHTSGGAGNPTTAPTTSM